MYLFSYKVLLIHTLSMQKQTTPQQNAQEIQDCLIKKEDIRIYKSKEIYHFESFIKIKRTKQLAESSNAMPLSRGLSITIAVLLFSITVSFKVAVDEPIYIQSQQAKGSLSGTVMYEPNMNNLPANSTITKIQIALGQYIDGLIVYLTSPNGTNYTFNGFGFSTRTISETYYSPPGNMIKQIVLASIRWSDGHKNFCGIQFKGTKQDSPFYTHSACPKNATYETLYTFGDNPVAFYGHLSLTYRTVYGIGMVMEKIT